MTASAPAPVSAAYARGLVNGAVMVAWWRYRSGLRDLNLPLAANAERRQALRQLMVLRRALRERTASS